MGKFARILAVTAIATSFMGGVVSADTTCNGNVSNTGPGSTNSVTCVDSESNNLSCVNNVVVNNNNDQSSSTGGAFTVGNTTSGGSTSGDSGNNNTVILTVGESCTPVASTVTTTPTTPANPTTPQVLGNSTATPQVVAPAGAVHAGGGAGVATSPLVATGLISSVSAIAAGVALAVRKRALSL